MKKTGIAAMMLSTAIAVSGIAVPVCAAPGQTAGECADAGTAADRDRARQIHQR